MKRIYIMITLWIVSSILLVVWIVSLQNQLQKAEDRDDSQWIEKYNTAQDSILLITKERDILKEERVYLDSTRRYWKNQYLTQDSLLNLIKPKYDEDILNIHNADANERNSLLSDRLRKIHNH